MIFDNIKNKMYTEECMAFEVNNDKVLIKKLLAMFEEVGIKWTSGCYATEFDISDKDVVTLIYEDGVLAYGENPYDTYGFKIDSIYSYEQFTKSDMCIKALGESLKIYRDEHLKDLMLNEEIVEVVVAKPHVLVTFKDGEVVCYTNNKEFDANKGVKVCVTKKRVNANKVKVEKIKDKVTKLIEEINALKFEINRDLDYVNNNENKEG